MLIFSTDRLDIRKISEADAAYFKELLTSREIIDPIPQPVLPDEKVKELFEGVLAKGDDFNSYERNVWGVFEKGESELIGFALLITNEEGDRELGYRFRPAFWGKGYGTEVYKGIITYSFNVLGINKITADVHSKNNGSVRILGKFMKQDPNFINKRDNSFDLRYVLYKDEWEKI